jgi:large subunit ribosomal protein L15
MKLHDLHTTPGSKHRIKRVGRGDASGWGRTCGRGEKGQMSRSGAKHRPYFEGGQIPLFRRIPKRGFKSINHKEFNIVNLSVINSNFESSEVVDIESLREKGIVGDNKLPLKILANGDISISLTVKANKFSAVAIEKIEAAGGSCEVV